MPREESKPLSQATARALLTPANAENYIPVTETGCWLFTGAWCVHGYGKCHNKGHWHIKAHRLFYAANNGDIPAGALVCHKCDVRACVNPDHLVLGDNDWNMRDMARKKRSGGFRGGASKLTAAQAVEIYQSTGSRSSLSRQFGVSVATVGNIKRGSQWAHVTIPASEVSGNG